MLWDASAVRGYSISGSDGSIGSVSDILFDDDHWKARWLVVETGGWCAGRKVLLPVSALGKPNPSLHAIGVKLTMQQVKDSPDIDTQRPVSRQAEADIHGHYGLQSHWGGGVYPINNGIAVPPLAPRPPGAVEKELRAMAEERREREDPHLRSVEAVTGYRIHATDGEIGHVEDFLFEDADWTVRYLEVATRNWWPGKRVLIFPRLVREIDWAERLVHLKVSRQSVQDSPPYDPSITIDGAYAEKFQTYYGGF